MSPRYEYRVVDRDGRNTLLYDTFTDRRGARKWKSELATRLPVFGPYRIQRKSLEWEDVL